MTVGRETSHDVLFAKPIRDREPRDGDTRFPLPPGEGEGEGHKHGPRPSPRPLTLTLSRREREPRAPGGGPSGRGGAKGGAVGVWPERGAPPCGRPATLRTLDDSEPDRVKSPNGRARDCGVCATLSRIASNRQTAARNSVKPGQHLAGMGGIAKARVAEGFPCLRERGCETRWADAGRLTLPKVLEPFAYAQGRLFGREALSRIAKARGDIVRHSEPLWARSSQSEPRSCRRSRVGADVSRRVRHAPGCLARPARAGRGDAGACRTWHPDRGRSGRVGREACLDGGRCPEPGRFLDLGGAMWYHPAVELPSGSRDRAGCRKCKGVDSRRSGQWFGVFVRPQRRRRYEPRPGRGAPGRRGVPLSLGIIPTPHRARS